MKVTCLCLLIALIQSLNAFSQKPYVINGMIDGLPDGTVISLMVNEGTLLSTIANDMLRNGKFRFSGMTEGLSSMAITGRGSGFPSQWLDVFVAPGVWYFTKVMGRLQ